MRKEVTQKQKDQWKETKRKGVAKYQEKQRSKPIVYNSRPVLKSNPKKTVYKIKPRTKKRAADERKYNARVRELKSDPENRCVAKLEGCTEEFSENHHKKGRRDKLLLDEQYWLFLCGNCHRFIHENPKMALKLGLSVLKHTK